MKFPARFALSLLAVLLALATLAEARFVDPLPFRTDPPTAVESAGGLHISGHSSGLVVGMNPTTGLAVWSQLPSGWRVTDLARLGESLLVAQSSPNTLVGMLSRIDALNGSIQWRAEFGSGLNAIAVEGDDVVIAFQNGTLSRFEPATRTRPWMIPGTGPARTVDLLGGRVLAGVGDRLELRSLDGGALLFQTPLTAARVALTSGGAVSVQTDGTVQRFTIDGDVLATAGSPSAPAGATAVDAGFGRVLIGNASSLLFTHDEALGVVLPRISAYAGSVNDVFLLDAENALVAFEGGWMGVVPLKAQPIVLFIWPQPARFVRSPVEFQWAYAHPAAQPGDRVTYRLEARIVGETTWRELASGSSPVAELTTRHTAPIDLSAFPSGTRIEVRVELRDGAGRTGEDYILEPFTLDHDAPVFVGAPAPAEGEVLCRPGPGDEPVCTARPTIVVGHRDIQSAIDPADTVLWVDGSRTGWNVEPARSLTRATPYEDLSEGRHDWKLQVYDSAGNLLEHESHFIVDTRPAAISDVHRDALSSTLVAFSFRTDEEAQCVVRTTDGAGWASETAPYLAHGAVLAGLSPARSYTVVADCLDAGGRNATTTLQTFQTPDCPGCRVPTVTVSTDPVTPDGAAGWFTTVDGVDLTVAALPAEASVWVSVDSSPFQASPGTVALPPGRHDYRFFATSTEGAASVVTARTFLYDPTPPPDPAGAWTPTLTLLSWQAVDDVESGMEEFLVQGRTTANAGAWQELAQVTWPGHRYEEVPAGFAELRAVAVNRAGLSTAGSPVSAPSTAVDNVRTVANVVSSTILSNETVRINYRLAPGATYETVVLVTQNGVERPFVGTPLRLGTHLFQAWERAEPFGPGKYAALVRVTADGQRVDVDAGNVTIVQAGQDTSGNGGTPSCTSGVNCPKVRRVPGIEIALVAVGIVLGLVSRRRT